LYWKEQRTLTELAAMFDVTHKSVHRVFEQLGITTRSKSKKINRGCIECGKRVFLVWHAKHRVWYGRRCKSHWNKHRAALAKAEFNRPGAREKKQAHMRRWYLSGPINPKGERQWLRKSRHTLRTLKRELQKPSLDRLALQNTASKLDRSLRA
jgi:predicted  nucleic acid-binding Zn-ribbon protein